MKKSDNIEEFSGTRWKEKIFADSSLIEGIKYDFLMQTLFVKFKNKENTILYLSVYNNMTANIDYNNLIIKLNYIFNNFKN